VHDELVLEVGEKDLEATEELVKREMAGSATLAVPLDVEVGHGRSWAEAH
jgi:DNA polymerase-1